MEYHFPDVKKVQKRSTTRRGKTLKRAQNVHYHADGDMARWFDNSVSRDDTPAALDEENKPKRPIAGLFSKR